MKLILKLLEKHYFKKFNDKLQSHMSCSMSPKLIGVYNCGFWFRELGSEEAVNQLIEQDKSTSNGYQQAITDVNDFIESYKLRENL